MLDGASIIGTRVSVNGEFATVLFDGQVGDTKGEWLGVEWDDPSRGKHDGTHGGDRYFTPTNPGPTCCSFLRRTKVSFGGDLVEGVKRRYGKVEGETAGVGQQNIDELQKEIGARFVQVVGFDKVNSEQCQFEKLRSVSVRNLNINDSKVDLVSTLPSLVDLDLSENLLSSWTRTSELVGQVQLKILNISSNRLSVPDVMPVDKFSHLQHLILGEMGYSWADVENIAGDLPELQNLQVHKNRISAIEVKDGKFLKLKELDLDCNDVSSWSSICNLNKIENLAYLRLNENKLTTIDVTPDIFRNLRILHISENLLDDWMHIGKLNSLSLSELRFRKNPLLKDKKEDVCRTTVIALINSLNILNGTTITENEKKWAEIDYYKKHGMEYLKILKAPENERAKALESFSASHGRYLEIVGKFGVPDEAELVVKENNLKSSLLSIKLRAPDVPGAAEFVKKLPSSMTITKLKALVARLYRSSGGSGLPSLYLISSKSPNQEEELDNDLRELSYFSVETGDVLLVRWS